MMDPWRARHFGAGYSAEYLPPGQVSWRILKSGGEPIVYPSASQALGAAKNAYLQRHEPAIRATIPQDPERIAARLSAEAEQWIRTNRQSVKGAETHHRPGKRPLKIMHGRAR